MQTPPPNEITMLLRRWSQGDSAALDQLMPIVLRELRKLAGGYLKSERPNHTLQPTALINEAYLRQELATAYLRVGDVQGSPNRANLGQTAAALESYRRGVEIAEKLRAGGQADDSLLRVLADAYGKTGKIKSISGKYSEAKAPLQKSLAIGEQLFASGARDAATYRLILTAYKELGEISALNGDESTLTPLHRKIVGISESWVKEQRTVQSRGYLALNYYDLAGEMIGEGDLNGAREYSHRALAIQNKLCDEAPNNAVCLRMQSNIYLRLGDVALDMGEIQQSVQYYRQALAISEDLASKDPKNTLDRLNVKMFSSNLGVAILETDPKQAAELFRKALDSGGATRPAAAQYRIHQVFNYIDLARALWLTGDRQNALKNLREAQDMIQAVPARRLYDMGIYAHSARANTGDLLLEMGDYPAALEHFRQALKNAQERIAEQPLRLTLRRGLANCYAKLGKYYSTLAAKSGAQVETQIAHWREARNYYQKSLETSRAWAKLTESNSLSARMAETAARAIAQCDAAINRLTVSPKR
ncbi:MAG: ECF-type sigma factor [Blastocatellales bacterium]